jgi:hypothetical protein
VQGRLRRGPSRERRRLGERGALGNAVRGGEKRERGAVAAGGDGPAGGRPAAAEVEKNLNLG